MNNLNTKNLLTFPLHIHNSWRFLNIDYTNKCDLIENENKKCNSIFKTPKIKNIHIYLNSWEAQKGCDDIKNKNLSHEDFQIGLMSFLQTFINNNVKIEKRKKEYSISIKAKKKSKMKKNIILESYTFKSILKTQDNIYAFLEYIFLEVLNTADINFLLTKKMFTIKKKHYYFTNLSLRIPLDSFSDLIEHNRLNLNEIFILKDIHLHININLKHHSKDLMLDTLYPFWLTETSTQNSVLNNL
ncbi:MAG: hypothetical protein ACXVH2_01725 [Methanobacterium sp.]